MIYYSQEYHDERGATIIQHHIEDGLPPEDFPIFLGVGHIQIPTPMGPTLERVFVKIEADSLTEAFLKFEKTMQEEGPKEVEKLTEKIRKNISEMQKVQNSKIIIPNSTPPLPEFQGLANSL